MYSKAFVGARQRLDLSVCSTFLAYGDPTPLGSDEIFSESTLSSKCSSNCDSRSAHSDPVPTLGKPYGAEPECTGRGSPRRNWQLSLPSQARIIPKGKVKKRQTRLVCGHQQVRLVRSTGAFVASVVPCEHAANVFVLSGNDGRLSEAPIRHSAPVLFLN